MSQMERNMLQNIVLYKQLETEYCTLYVVIENIITIAGMNKTKLIDIIRKRITIRENEEYQAILCDMDLPPDQQRITWIQRVQIGNYMTSR